MEDVTINEVLKDKNVALKEIPAVKNILKNIEATIKSIKKKDQNYMGFQKLLV